MSANFWPSRSSSVSPASKKPQNASYSLETVDEEGGSQLHPSSNSSSSASCETPPNAEKTVECSTPQDNRDDQEKLKPILKNSSMKSANVFRISIQDSLDKVVELPSLCVWDRLESPANFMRGRLPIQLRTKGFLIRRETGWMGCYCLISRQGHLIVYAREKDLKGYAVNLSKAKKVVISCGKVQENSSAKKKVFKKYCLLTIKWKFGTISINLLENQIHEWRRFILDAYEQNFESHPFSCTLSNSMNQNENTPQQEREDDHTPRIKFQHDDDVFCNANYDEIGSGDGDLVGRDGFSPMEFLTSSDKVSRVAEKSTNNVRRRHSEAAWIHSKSHYDKKPLPDWVNDFGTANRFRLTKEYFENYENN